MWVPASWFEDPRVVKAGTRAAFLYLAAMGYAIRNSTGGLVPAALVRKLTDEENPAELAGALLEANLFLVEASSSNDYRLADFGTWLAQANRHPEAKQNRSALSQVRAEAGRMGGLARVANRKQTEASAQANGVANGKQGSAVAVDDLDSVSGDPDQKNIYIHREGARAPSHGEIVEQVFKAVADVVVMNGTHDAIAPLQALARHRGVSFHSAAELAVRALVELRKSCDLPVPLSPLGLVRNFEQVQLIIDGKGPPPKAAKKTRVNMARRYGS